jgi:hypothetical protein
MIIQQWKPASVAKSHKHNHPTHDETTHDDAATKKFGRHRSHANDAKATTSPTTSPTSG